MKQYLLIVNEHYYPSFDTEDWVGTFETYTEALEESNKRKTDNTSCYIVDLLEWMHK